MTKTALLATAAVLAISAGALAGTRNPVVSNMGFDVHATRLTISNARLKTVYSQNDNDSGVAVNSQSFESSFSAYDDQGADDFVVPSGSVWTIQEVDVTGVFYNGSGPAASENVFFYKNSHGLPGKLVTLAANLNGIENGNGSFAIKIPALKLKAGHYWVSVQANCSFTGGCGEWGWEVRSVKARHLAAYQSAKNGPCPVWATMETCLGAGPDFMFALKGSK